MRLHYREQGSGPALIILHGLFGSLENWAYVSQRLAEEFRVFSVDQRNHGQSPHAAEMNFRVLAADVREFMDAQGLSSASVLGHSMGGKAAMELALGSPGRLDRLVVVDMAPRSYPPRHESIFNGLLGLDLARFQTRAQIEAALEPAIPDLAVRRFLLKGVAQREPGVFSWRFNLPVLRERYRELTEAIPPGRRCDRPALFIRGEQSDYISDADAAEIREFFPRADIVTIANAGHWVHAEQAEIFVNEIAQFLREKI